MLSGSALLRVVLTLVVAALLAALWQTLPSLTGGPATAPPVQRPSPSRTPEGVRAVGPPATPVPPRARAEQPVPVAAPPAPTPAPPPSPPAPVVPSPAIVAPTPTPPPPPAADVTALRQGTPAAADTRPIAVDLLDLNTASVQDLNRLRGAGLIGRAIQRGRPYASVDDLLTKRVLSRSSYDRIRDQVTVRLP